MVRGAGDLADLGLNDLVQGLGQKCAEKILARVLLDEGQQDPGDEVRIVGHLWSLFRVANSLNRP